MKPLQFQWTSSAYQPNGWRFTDRYGHIDQRLNIRSGCLVPAVVASPRPTDDALSQCPNVPTPVRAPRARNLAMPRRRDRDFLLLPVASGGGAAPLRRECHGKAVTCSRNASECPRVGFCDFSKKWCEYEAGRCEYVIQRGPMDPDPIYTTHGHFPMQRRAPGKHLSSHHFTL